MGVNSLDEDVRRTLARPVLAAGWIGVAVAALPTLAGVELPTTLRYAPLVASVVLFGFPHGAIDYVALPRAVAGRVTGRWLAVVGCLYLVLGGAYAAAWFAWPVAAALAFVALTWLHWGQGDVYSLAVLLDADYLDSRARRVATGVVRGGLPMLVPLLGHPETYREVVAAFAAPFGGNVGDLWLFTPDARLVLGVAFAVVTVGTLAANRLATAESPPTAWRVDAAETVGLWAFFLVVPPVFAVGVYFCLWHAVRHVARAVAVDGTSRHALAAGDLRKPLARFAREATPLTVAALALLAGFWVAVPNPPTTLAGATGLYLAFVAVLTLPHVAAVTWMDRAAGLL
ncbi:Brp/Blh family beta-carotene 15,15'-dioxygenase [Halobacterium sp. KA-6]|uniref:Brp/Blh family beta-carotene 15,15'-dioxygenase n=1 Tax=Halobacterium sp. KA-6 TaxID=2896368 RepID=UPI001E2F2260|nr:Brp/Blh family beta-carotene 15,15'-dioxygenase [Halobacterium sp. KA-6]MCD2202921.1 Brp/Blh family beta-carotene 15,15'-dioxygenase [Halobacterium sp. KA-6]